MTKADDLLAQAITSEDAIGAEAAKIRGDSDELTPALLGQLWTLLRKPIPQAFIEHVGVVTGKPYDSTGVKSVQVQIDRMDRVLGPTWWHDKPVYLDDGKLCHVTVFVGSDRENPLYWRESWGGVERGSTQGNIRKGAYTNAAKLAFARVGPGWEVYVGAGDLDPDTSEAAAKAQERPAENAPKVARIDSEGVLVLRELFDASGVEPQKLKLRLGAMGVSAGTVNTGLANLTPAQGVELQGWLAEQKPGEKS